MGHYDDLYAIDDERRFKAKQKMLDDLAERLSKAIDERGLPRVLAEIAHGDWR